MVGGVFPVSGVFARLASVGAGLQPFRMIDGRGQKDLTPPSTGVKPVKESSSRTAVRSTTTHGGERYQPLAGPQFDCV